MSEQGTVLIVDDDAIIRKVFSRFLREKDCRISEAEDGAPALEMLRKQHFDLTLLDLVMPEVDGYTVLEAIRDEGLQTIPIVLTGFGEIAAAVKAMKLGAFDFLAKPSDPENFLLAVERAFTHHNVLAHARKMTSLAEEWKQVFDASPDPIIVTDTDFRIVKCNKAVLERFGKTGEEFCHIELYGPFDENQFISGTNVKPLRCPVCGYRETNWQPIVEAWKRDRTPWHCPSCENDISLEQLRWNKSAGFGRFFIKVWGIFESEAVPGDKLLATLKATTNSKWDYFYYRGEPF